MVCLWLSLNFIFTGLLASGAAAISCGCTCPSSWVEPPGWTGGTPGPVAIIHFEDTSCFNYHGGLESQIKVPAYVSAKHSTLL